jgi:hypothetical protein
VRATTTCVARRAWCRNCSFEATGVSAADAGAVSSGVFEWRSAFWNLLRQCFDWFFLLFVVFRKQAKRMTSAVERMSVGREPYGDSAQMSDSTQRGLEDDETRLLAESAMRMLALHAREKNEQQPRVGQWEKREMREKM